jgi:hypothetical protein
MILYYQDYYWRKGKPYGRHSVDPLQPFYSYKIVSDPYHKRYSIEKYRQGVFEKIIYDSIFLDFRHLNPVEQTAWSKEVLKEEQIMKCLLRNQDDRAVILETYYFEGVFCRLCQLSSIHGFLLSNQRMYYQALKDSFNGVILYDSEDRPVMKKTYRTNLETGEFTVLLSEEWNMENVSEGLLNANS